MMKIAIFEAITTPGGHEGDFDRILTEEITALGHEVVFCVPQDFVFPLDYGVSAIELDGSGISYTGLKGAAKIWASLKREVRRQSWYRQLLKLAQSDEFDALIIPTSTYRYLRALNLNPLKDSPKPVIFILHGINPGEAPKFYCAVEKLADKKNIHMAVLGFSDDVLGRSFEQVHCIAPPAYIARDVIEAAATPLNGRPLSLGFFGQYRREKQLDKFLTAFLSRDYAYPVELLVQGATMRPEDSEDFERIIAKYQGESRVRFLHKGLWGAAWQKAIQDVDALLMPYGAPRYRYHWAGMLFTAIGYQKPVVASDEINPEVFGKYEIGMTFDSAQPDALTKVLADFIDTYPEREAHYHKELQRAGEAFAPRGFAAKLVDLVSS